MTKQNEFRLQFVYSTQNQAIRNKRWNKTHFAYNSFYPTQNKKYETSDETNPVSPTIRFHPTKNQSTKKPNSFRLQFVLSNSKSQEIRNKSWNKTLSLTIRLILFKKYATNDETKRSSLQFVYPTQNHTVHNKWRNKTNFAYNSFIQLKIKQYAANGETKRISPTIRFIQLKTRNTKQATRQILFTYNSFSSNKKSINKETKLISPTIRFVQLKIKNYATNDEAKPFHLKFVLSIQQIRLQFVQRRNKSYFTYNSFFFYLFRLLLNDVSLVNRQHCFGPDHVNIFFVWLYNSRFHQQLLHLYCLHSTLRILAVLSQPFQIAF